MMRKSLKSKILIKPLNHDSVQHPSLIVALQDMLVKKQFLKYF